MDSYQDSLNALRALRSFQGRDGEFWFTYAEHSCRLFTAERAYFLRKGANGWSLFCFWPLSAAQAFHVDPLLLGELAEQSLHAPVAYSGMKDAQGGTASGTLLCVRLHGVEADGEMMALYVRSSATHDPSSDRLKRELIHDIPAACRMNRAMVATTVQERKDGWIDPLDVMLCMNEHSGFLGAAMALCNELASRFGCSRISLGWKEGEYVRLRAMSHTERFDRKMSIVQALESVMEECLDQDDELLFPEQQGSGTVIREHRNFAARQGLTAMLSLPLRIDQNVVAVLSCEREKPFTAEEIRALRIISDQVIRRLADLRHYDRWFGAVAVDAMKQWGVSVFGKDSTIGRMYAAAAGILLLILIFGTLDYRVEAPFILRTRDLVLLSSPYDGYIEGVLRKPGDIVAAGQLLMRLDTRQLLLEQSRTYADVQRYLQEEKKAMAQGSLAEMKVSEALRHQAESRFELINDNLEHAEIKAPFAGVVVEGDLEKLLGAPVRKGDVLLKVARLENLYVEIRVPERDIHEFRVGQAGEVAFISQPGNKFNVVVDRIEPIAVTEEKGNAFLVLGRITDTRKEWWRPGMSGLAKLSAGRRHILWIMLHRTIDFIHMKLWW